jgi:hypothetical protein
MPTIGVAPTWFSRGPCKTTAEDMDVAAFQAVEDMIIGQGWDDMMVASQRGLLHLGAVLRTPLVADFWVHSPLLLPNLVRRILVQL